MKPITMLAYLKRNPGMVASEESLAFIHDCRLPEMRRSLNKLVAANLGVVCEDGMYRHDDKSLSLISSDDFSELELYREVVFQGEVSVDVLSSIFQRPKNQISQAAYRLFQAGLIKIKHGGARKNAAILEAK